ncbi:hypothetical protein FRC08_007530 [Ceratobasidium sp. 394]|nr:hypothetical protein FRC08_007530 [Ceratobasidium sp. 394]KAG9090317.1 hypothetical protein FS749_000655 [Ceratobasidium sp. UAMH 11750]
MDPPSPTPASSAPKSNATPSTSNGTLPPKQPKPKAVNSKPKGKSKKSKQRKATKWADKCMYAELLEMRDTGDTWASGDDGLPMDLEQEWVALAPVPKGKRCIAVSFAPSVSGPDEATNVLQANTALHSRVKGLAFMRFPAPLPPDTVLDCILDDDVAQTGVLHVLDVIRWRGTDVADCEADFRFWFRDARLAELVPQPEPSRTATGSRPYPHRFLGVPYYLPPLTYTLFLQSIIPAARPQGGSTDGANETDMDTGEGEIEVRKSDGILLYVKEAAYTSGETPLSCWVPAAPLDDAMDQEPPLQVFQRLISKRASVPIDMMR